MRSRNSLRFWGGAAGVVFILCFVMLLGLLFQEFGPPQKYPIHFNPLVPYILFAVAIIAGSFFAYSIRREEKWRLEEVNASRLPFRQDTHETAFAPWRWSPLHRHESRTAALARLRRRCESLQSECDALGNVVCPDMRYQVPFQHELRLLLNNVKAHRDHVEVLTRGHLSGTLSEFDGDYLTSSYFSFLYQSTKAIEGLKSKYQIDAVFKAQTSPYPSPVEQKFIQVFFNKTGADRERVIELVMRLKQCTREEAMLHAVEKLQHDIRSWR